MPSADAEAQTRPTKSYRIVRKGIRIILKSFFRQLDIAGLEYIPKDRGGILVSWHPNGLVDPALMLTSFPHELVFGARHGLFRWPLLGRMLVLLGVVPIYRTQDLKNTDPEKRRASNRKSLDRLAHRIGQGAFSSLFPEGVSHDEPFPVALKTGIARLYYQAQALTQESGPPPAIIPVGLHYDKKRVFRSRALVWFHPPLELPKHLEASPPTANEEAEQQRNRALTQQIERSLREVVHATEDWETHRVLHRGRKLIRAERAQRASSSPKKPDVKETALGFARVRKAYYQLKKVEPGRVASLRARVEAYDRDLRALGLSDHHLDQSPKMVPGWLAVILLLQLIFVYLLLPPILLVGYLVNGPTALLILSIAHLFAAKGKDIATIKMLLGALLFPLTWLGAGFLGAMLHEELHLMYPRVPSRPALAGLVLSMWAAVGGVISIRYLHVARDTKNAIRVRLTKARRRAHVQRLLKERHILFDAMTSLAEGIPLPGTVTDRGTLELKERDDP